MTDTATVHGAKIEINITPEDIPTLPAGSRIIAGKSVPEADGNFLLQAIQIVPDWKSWKSSEIALQEIVEIGNCAGIRAATALLLHQEDIPVEWRKYNLYFAGTTVESLPEAQSIPAMLFCSIHNKWELNTQFVPKTWTEQCLSMHYIPA